VAVGGEWRQQKGPKWDRIVVEEEVEGQISEAAFPLMVGEIQRHLDLVGHASVIGGTLTWSPAAQSESTRRIVISVTPRGGRTLIRLQETLEIQGFKKVVFPIGALTGAAFGAAIAGGLGMGEPAGPLFAIAFIGMGIFSALRLTTSIDAGEKGPQLQALGRALTEIGAEASEKRLGPG
jgi:hypothetical protein